MQIDFLEYNGIGYQAMTAQELLAAGVPQATIEEAIAKIRVSQIKQECRRRIYAIADAESQMNMAAASAVISGKTAANRTEAEKAVLANAELAIDWVAAMRANIATLAADANAVITDDANWPDCPPEVIALASQF